jgi:peptidoglycan/xylan/chitin deacetylase (PgdA/CDA1 family)
MIQQNIPALLYHRIDTRWDVGVTWSTLAQFKSHLQRLQKAGWNTVALPSASDICQVCQTPQNTSDRLCYLIFDDGYEGICKYAFPILRDLGFSASVFIPTGFIGHLNTWDHNLLGRRFRHLDRSMLEELSSAGWMIGSHGVTHRYFGDLCGSDLKSEMMQSRRQLEDIIGKPVEWISFPFGRHSRRIIEAAQEAGFTGAVVPLVRRVEAPDDFNIIHTEPVYWWNNAESVVKIVTDYNRRGNGRWIVSCANRLNAGTIIWRRIFKRHFRLD